ncbi:MAG TPA: DUF4870 domain-containing protein [Pyrinomonadaceae bacterium]
MQNQPPVQVSSQPPAQAGKSSTGLDENVAALLSYVFGWISGLIFFLMEKDSRLVRFHGMQSILLNVTFIVILIALYIAWAVVVIVLAMISEVLASIGGLLIGLLILVFCIAVLAAWVMCLIKAYGNQYFKLPVIGNFAEKFSMK